jgi:hypothetical protein
VPTAYFELEDNEQIVRLQKALFIRGYFWPGGDRVVREAAGAPWLVVNSDGFMSFLRVPPVGVRSEFDGVTLKLKFNE